MNNEFPELEQPQAGFACMENLVDKQLKDMERAIGVFAEKPANPDNANLLTEVLSAHTEAVGLALDELSSEYPNKEEALRPLLTYVHGLELRRVDHLNSLEIGDVEYGAVYTIDELCEVLQDEDRGAAETANMHYQRNLSVDMRKLSETALDEYSKKPSTKRREKMRLIGRYGLDVTKIGLGVVGGVAAAKKMKLF